MRARPTIALALFAATSACSTPKPRAVPEAEARAIAIPFEEYRLRNGLRVVLSEDHRAPVASIVVVYAVGSREDPPGKSGLAHLFEHVVFDGGGAMTPDEYWRHMDEAGRTFANAFTSFDTTRYVERVAARGVPFALWIEAARMAYGGATFDRARLDAVRGVVESERKQRYENAPYGNVVGFLNEALFPEGHPYRRLGIGSAAQLASITVDDVKRFYATHYTPDSATLVVVGDFDIAACKREIEADFGPIPRGTSTPLPTPAITAPHATSKTITIRADVKTPRTYVAWVTPGSLDPRADLAPLAGSVAMGVRERLTRERLIDEGSHALHQHALAGVFVAEFTPSRGVTLDTLDARIDRWFPNFRQGFLNEEGLDSWRRSAITHVLERFDDTLGRAEDLAEAGASFEGAAHFGSALRHLETASLAEAWQVTNDLLATSDRVVAHVVVDPSAPRAGALVEAK